MRADDVVNARFQPTKFREGYDQGQVDDLLDRVAATLRAGEEDASRAEPTSARDATMARFASTRASTASPTTPTPGDARVVTVDELVSIRFTPTRFREGYDQGQVDDFIDEVVVELRRRAQA